MEFLTQYDKQERTYSNPGSPVKMEMAPVLDKYGNKTIEPKGPIDLYSQIQSWRDECDINILMAKFTNGDRTALMQRVGAYLDLTQIPDNFNDMLNLTTQASSVFDSLPVEVKEVFGNNVNNFLANSKTKEFAEIMSQSPEDIRKAKMTASREYEKVTREAAQPFYAQKSALMVDSDIPVEPIENPLVNEAAELLSKRGVKLNESK